MTTKSGKTGAKPNKAGVRWYVRLMMVICSLSSLYTVVSKCFVWKDSKFEFSCTIPGCLKPDFNNHLCNYAFVVFSDLSGTPSQKESNVITSSVVGDVDSNPAPNVLETNSHADSPAMKTSRPKFYKPKQLLEYTDQDSIQVQSRYVEIDNILNICFELDAACSIFRKELKD